MTEEQQKKLGFYNSEEEFLKENPKPEDRVCKHGVTRFRYHPEKKEVTGGRKYWSWRPDITPCEQCRAEEKEAEKKERLDEEKRKAFLQISKRYREAPEKSRYYDKYLEKGGILFSGDVGTGKTYEAVSLLKNIFIETGELPRFTTAVGLGMKLKQAVSSGNHYKAVTDLAEQPVFCVDDLGAENTTEFFKEALYFIVNRRYNDLQPIIITTNLNTEEILERYGQPFLSRIVEAVEIVRLEGKDKRLNERVNEPQAGVD